MTEWMWADGSGYEGAFKNGNQHGLGMVRIFTMSCSDLPQNFDGSDGSTGLGAWNKDKRQGPHVWRVPLGNGSWCIYGADFMDTGDFRREIRVWNEKGVQVDTITGKNMRMMNVSFLRTISNC
jgi:hypothetical protein